MAEGCFELSYPVPAHASRYREWFHAPVSFGHREAAVVIPAEWLRLECPLADPLTFDAACRRLVSGARRLDAGGAFVARVEHLVAAREGLDSTAVARLLRVSRRTLGRRLRDGGTSWRDLVDATRRSRAEALLRERHLDVAEVGYAVGYEDPANFGRACRRWFGMSAGAYRRLLDGKAS
jgi:AraC-like DNA-binding protein